jgi:hypothetical protein
LVFSGLPSGFLNEFHYPVEVRLGSRRSSTAENHRNCHVDAGGWPARADLGIDQATASRIENGAELKGPVNVLLEKLMTEPTSEAAAG